MNARRIALCCLALGLAATAVLAQGRGRGAPTPADPSIYDSKQSIPCPLCDKLIEFDVNSPPATCPHCSKKVKIEKKGEDGWTVKSEEANPMKKILLIAGGSILGLALLGLVLKMTVFKAAPPPKKKKKKRRDDDDDDDDDRPKKKRRPVAEDDDERSRKVRKPRIVEDDED